MSKKRRRSRPQTQQQQPVKRGREALLNHLLALAFGLVIAGGVALLVTKGSAGAKNLTSPGQSSLGVEGNRTVAQLMALSDTELERVDIVEMNVPVAWEIPGLDNLDYEKYRRIVDGWTDQFRAWLSTVEHAFRQDQGKYYNDMNFLRPGMLAEFLDQSIAATYVEKQKQAQIDAHKTDRKADVACTDPRHVLLHGAISQRKETIAGCPRGGATVFCVPEVTILEIASIQTKRRPDPQIALKLLAISLRPSQPASKRTGGPVRRRRRTIPA